MPKEKQIKLTKFEMEIMSILWELGRGSVREIQEEIPEKNRPAYTTVQTIIYRLEEKGAVKKIKKIGNAFIFEPSVTRQSIYRRLLGDFLDLFGGPRPLMAHLAETGKLSLEDVKDLESSIKRLEEESSSKKRLGDDASKSRSAKSED